MTDSGNVFEATGVSGFRHKLLAKGFEPSLRSRCHDGSLSGSMKLGDIKPAWFLGGHTTTGLAERGEVYVVLWRAEVRKDETARGLESYHTQLKDLLVTYC